MAEEAGRRIALVVSAASGSELVAGQSDVMEVWSRFVNKKLGQCLKPASATRLNATRSDFQSGLDDVLEQWSPDDQLVLYFSGHGAYVPGGEYAFLFREGEKYRPYFFSALLSELKCASVRKAILIIDACFSGAALTTGTKSTDSKPFQPKRETIPAGIVVIASSTSGQRSHEIKDGSNSVFTSLMIDAIDTGLWQTPTPDDEITAGDLVGAINDQRPDLFPDDDQTAIYEVRGAERKIWITKNSTKSDGIHPPVAPSIAPFADAEVSEVAVAGFLQELAAERRREYNDRPLDEVLSELNVLKDGVLTMDGVLVFSRKPQTFLPAAYVQCTRYLGVRRDTKEFQKSRIEGNVLEQIQGVFDFVALANVPVQSRSGDRWKRSTRSTYPELCLREVILNAITHRDYTDRHRAIHVRLFDDRVEISSPGSWANPDKNLSDPVPMSDLESQSVKRNHVLANCLSFVEYFEGEGAGLPVSVSDARRGGGQVPTVQMQDGFVVVTIYPYRFDEGLPREIRAAVGSAAASASSLSLASAHAPPLRGFAVTRSEARLSSPEQTKLTIQLEPSRVSGADELARARLTILTGPPGSGKTEVLRVTAQHYGQQPEGTPLPLLFGAGLLASDDFAADLAADLERTALLSLTPEDLGSVLEVTKVLLLVDGWDEVPLQHIDACRQKLIALQEANPNLSAIVATRSTSSFPNSQELSAAVCTLAPLNDRVAAVLLTEMFGNDRPELVDELIASISTDDDLGAFLRTPAIFVIAANALRTTDAVTTDLDGLVPLLVEHLLLQVVHATGLEQSVLRRASQLLARRVASNKRTSSSFGVVEVEQAIYEVAPNTNSADIAKSIKKWLVSDLGGGELNFLHASIFDYLLASSFTNLIEGFVSLSEAGFSSAAAMSFAMADPSEQVRFVEDAWTIRPTIEEASFADLLKGVKGSADARLQELLLKRIAEWSVADRAKADQMVEQLGFNLQPQEDETS